MVTDPMYVKRFDSESRFDSVVPNLNDHHREEPLKAYPYGYGGASAASCSRDMAGPLGHEGREGVVVMSGWGDGLYPVFVEYDEETGRPARLVVEFIHNCAEDGHSFVDTNDPESPDGNAEVCEFCGKEQNV